ncbi:MAG: SRPBCC family protein [Myxococcales bacterium]|nr:SRPBCC family protein [Myxococcales bacterium]
MLLLIVSLLGPTAGAASADEPHPHQGVIAAYDGAPPMPELSAEDLAKLEAGDPVRKQVQTGTGSDAAGRGVAIQDIHADPDVVWGRILDFDAYPRMVDNVKSTSVYERSGEHLKVAFVIGAPMVSIEYYIDHVLRKDEGWMTWRLDYARHSDFDDTVGFWRVAALPDKPGWTRVVYSVELKASGWVPAPLENAFATMGLNKATSWVKREAEAAAGTSTGKR